MMGLFESTSSAEKARNQVANAFLDLSGILTQVRETAKGHRDGLIKDGWNESIAEQIAAASLIEMQRVIINGG